MRIYIILATALVLSSPWMWADSVGIVQVNAWATFTSGNPCVYDCTETIGVSFQFDNSPLQAPSCDPYFGLGCPTGLPVVAGTMSVSSSGFLGAFSGSGGVNLLNFGDEGFTPFFNAAGDEIDLWVAKQASGSPIVTNPFPIGVNTVGFTGWSCASRACSDAFGPDPFTFYQPTSQSSLVAPVAVPELSSWVDLLISAIFLWSCSLEIFKGGSSKRRKRFVWM